MRRTAIFLLTIWLSGCAADRYTPEPRHPSPERMQELLNAPISAIKQKELPFSLEVSPAMPMEGQAITLTCFVPLKFGRPGGVRIALEGVRASVVALTLSDPKMVVPGASCGLWVATCKVVTDTVTRVIRKDVEIRGGFCQ